MFAANPCTLNPAALRKEAAKNGVSPIGTFDEMLADLEAGGKLDLDREVERNGGSAFVLPPFSCPYPPPSSPTPAYAIVVYGSVARSQDHADIVGPAYSGKPERLWLMWGEDALFDFDAVWATLKPAFRGSTAIIFAREI